MEKPTTVRMSAEDRYRLQTLAVLFTTQTNVIHRAITLMWAEYGEKAEEVARIVRQERPMPNRVQQVSWLRELAGNITDNLGEGAAEELVAYALGDEGREDWAIEIPEWFDDHDRGLLVQFVGENLE